MTEVRIRGEYDTDGQSIGNVPFDQLDTVIPFIKSWGLYAGSDVDVADLCGQFVYAEGGAFFEVIFSEPADS